MGRKRRDDLAPDTTRVGFIAAPSSRYILLSHVHNVVKIPCRDRPVLLTGTPKLSHIEFYQTSPVPIRQCSMLRLSA